MAIADTTVKHFFSTMTGVGTMHNAAGTMITVLDQFLVDGFGTVTAASLVVSSNVATVTVNAGHNFAMCGNTGPVITIAGATPSALNREWRIASVTSSTVFTFVTADIADQTATGTITATRSPAGWSKVYSGTNKAVYRAPDGLRFYLRVLDDNSSNYHARVRGYESMSDVDTGTGPFPTDAQISGGVYFYKAQSASGQSPFFMAADRRGFYFFSDSVRNGDWSGGMFFTDLIADISTDNFYSHLCAAETVTVNTKLATLYDATAGYLARSYTQLSGSTTGYRGGPKILTGSGYGSYACDYPSAALGDVLLVPVDCWESYVRRGDMPGYYAPMTKTNVIPNWTILEGVVDDEPRTMVIQKTGSSMSMAFDITGPWR